MMSAVRFHRRALVEVSFRRGLYFHSNPICRRSGRAGRGWVGRQGEGVARAPLLGESGADWFRYSLATLVR